MLQLVYPLFWGFPMVTITEDQSDPENRLMAFAERQVRSFEHYKVCINIEIPADAKEIICINLVGFGEDLLGAPLMGSLDYGSLSKSLLL